jgi:hypothetical protein
VPEERRNGKPGRRRQDGLSVRMDRIEVALERMVSDFRDFRKETRAIRRTARLAGRTRVFLRYFNRCICRKWDRLHLWGKRQFFRWVVPLGLAYAAWQAWQQGKLTEWIERIWK